MIPAITEKVEISIRDRARRQAWFREGLFEGWAGRSLPLLCGMCPVKAARESEVFRRVV